MFPPNPSNPAANLAAPDFGRALAALLPPGRAFSGPNSAGLVAGLAGNFASLHTRAGQLSELEINPGTAEITFADWLEDYGLPDCCVPLGASFAEQQAALLGKIATIGGQSAAYYESVALSLGYTITITTFRPYTVGLPVGQPILGPAWLFAWQVNGYAITVVPFRAGDPVGNPLATWDNSPLVCRLQQIKPSVSVLLFNLTS